ncbi:hypothetical protein C8046_07675 [Serinibacter arcticus]|uniref:Uncharacterized protein n=1 Tax=Serinibacter arcticus TaxID=1655435 RepID=A0A2U1ZU91_9MICO|nr:hypothetical protein [Serinibacter arcticus]PWD50548.1 hypothetical protein C8046_07675 [Serinibacter arcticus]
MRTTPRPLVVAALITLTAVTACGAPGGSGEPPGSADPPAGGGQDDGVEYHVHAGIEERDGSGPVLCIGPMAAIYPSPPCGGPAVDGLDWDDVPDVSSADGITSGRAHLVGTYRDGTLTLTRPASAESPLTEEETRDAFGSASFEPLCTDPWRGGDEVAAADPMAWEAQNALVEAAQTLPGYVSMFASYSEGHSPEGFSSEEYNVVLSSSAEDADADAAHATLREVWPGWLCVAAQDLPTDADLQAANRAVVDLGERIGWQFSGLGVGVLDVSVVVADPATLAAIHDAVSPWLTPDQVVVHGDLQPIS